MISALNNLFLTSIKISDFETNSESTKANPIPFFKPIDLSLLISNIDK